MLRQSSSRLTRARNESINQNGYNLKTTSALLDWGVDPDGTTLEEPHLLVAVICDRETAISTIQLLLDAGADINVPNLLSRAAGYGGFEIVCELLDAGIDLNQFGPKALVYAVLQEHVATVALLIDRGTPINAIGKSLSPL